jgi:hypothetical protein
VQTALHATVNQSRLAGANLAYTVDDLTTPHPPPAIVTALLVDDGEALLGAYDPDLVEVPGAEVEKLES